MLEHLDNKYEYGDYVKKKGTKGQWHGIVVGIYSASCTEIGYAVESVFEEGSVQIYPEIALEPWKYNEGETIYDQKN